MIRASRLSALVSARWILFAGLAVVGVGCSTSDIPEEQKSTVQKVEDKAAVLTNEAADATATGLQKTGEAIVEGGKKLETSAAESVKKNVGEKAGEAVESLGKGIEKAGGGVESGGDKLKEAVAAPK